MEKKKELVHSHQMENLDALSLNSLIDRMVLMVLGLIVDALIVDEILVVEQ